MIAVAKRRFAARADEEVAAIRVRILAKRIRELEQALRKLSLENEILWEALKIAQEEKPTASP